GNDSGRFDLDAGAVGDQSAHLHQGYGREGAADDVAIGGADRGGARRIFLLVEDVPGHAGDMLGLGAGGGENLDDVAKGLTDLRHEIVAVELLLGVPADLAGDENQSAAADDAVRVSLGTRPPLRVHRTQRAHRYGLRLVGRVLYGQIVAPTILPRGVNRGYAAPGEGRRGARARGDLRI